MYWEGTLLLLLIHHCTRHNNIIVRDGSNNVSTVYLTYFYFYKSIYTRIYYPDPENRKYPYMCSKICVQISTHKMTETLG